MSHLQQPKPVSPSLSVRPTMQGEVEGNCQSPSDRTLMKRPNLSQDLVSRTRCRGPVLWTGVGLTGRGLDPCGGVEWIGVAEKWSASVKDQSFERTPSKGRCFWWPKLISHDPSIPWYLSAFGPGTFRSMDPMRRSSFPGGSERGPTTPNAIRSKALFVLWKGARKAKG